MDDKRDYKETLKALDTTTTIAAALNRLAAISVDTEDAKLRQYLDAICTRLRGLHQKPSTKVHLKGMPPSNIGDVAQLVRLVAAAWQYAEACRDAGEKQWEILARRAGWTPPAA